MMDGVHSLNSLRVGKTLDFAFHDIAVLFLFQVEQHFAYAKQTDDDGDKVHALGQLRKTEGHAGGAGADINAH